MYFYSLSTIPKNLNGFAARLRIAAGTYPENVVIQHFGNGPLYIFGNTGDAVNISGIEINNVQLVEINNLSISISESFLNVVGSNVRIFSPLITNGTRYGVYASYSSSVILRGTVTVNNAANAIFATSGSTIYVEHLLGSGISVSFASTLGSTCAFEKDESTATTKYYTLGGGRVFSGSQTNTPVN